MDPVFKTGIYFFNLSKLEMGHFLLLCEVYVLNNWKEEEKSRR